MINLTDGYYWLKNITYEDKVIFRPIRVTIIKESGYYFANNWYHPGTYFQWIGDSQIYNLHYFDQGWEEVEFIKLEEPKSEV